MVWKKSHDLIYFIYAINTIFKAIKIIKYKTVSYFVLTDNFIIVYIVDKLLRSKNIL